MTNALFDDLVDEANTLEPEETETAETQPEETASKRGRGARKLPEPVRERIVVENDDDVPEGYVSVKSFAFLVTQRNFENAARNGNAPTEADLVTENAVYMATTAKRHTVPSAQLVRPDGTEIRGGIVIPVEAGMTAWDARPERGEGTGRDLTEAQIATRVLRAGKAKARLAQLQARVQRYGELLAEVDKTWEDADAAYAEWEKSNKEDSAEDSTDSPE